MRGDLVMRSHRPIELGIHIQNARDAANARQNAILFCQNRGCSTLVGIDAGVAGRIARSMVLLQRVLDDCGNASAIPVHKSVVGTCYLMSSNSFSLLSAFSRKTANSCARFRKPS